DQETGVCIMQMDAGLDTGSVISRHKYTIKTDDTASEVHDALMQLGADAIVADLQQINQLQPIPQSETGVTYAHKLSKAEAQINWTRPAAEIVRKIRAFNPVPGAWTVWQDKPLKIWRAKIVSYTGIPGMVLHSNEHELIVACGKDSISIEEIQKAGSKAMSVTAFQAGNILQQGTLLASAETDA
ncbi:Methionyl-tRNA formyltransferase, partial [Snodgrassella alvi SCGC AB-598-P14]